MNSLLVDYSETSLEVSSTTHVLLLVNAALPELQQLLPMQVLGSFWQH
jgi:hypothetical protein